MIAPRIAEIAARHGVPIEQVRPASVGVANQVYLLGDGLVLRIPRSEPYIDDLRKEAVAIPLARYAGVRAPDVVTFDESRTVLEVPYLVQSRIPGSDLAQVDPPAVERERVYVDVGRQLALLHRVTAPGTGEIPQDDEGVDPYEMVNRLCSDGFIDVEAARWLDSWYDLLAERVPAEVARVLVHGDVAPQNIMVTFPPAELSGLVDWGDAEFADPAVDFAKTPLDQVPAMLAGYRAENGDDAAADGGWEARVLSHHLTWALGRLEDPTPRAGERHWTAPPASRLLGIMRFVASAPPEPWASLLPR